MTETAAPRPRRSVLYVPGSNDRAIEKARGLDVDGVILDLEDAVAPDAKADARRTVAEAVAARGFGHREVIVRVNGLASSEIAADLDAVLPAKPDAVLLPKCDSAADAAEFGRRLANANPAIRAFAMIETPRAVLNVAALAAAARDPASRLAGFVMGLNDLAKDTGVRFVPGRAPMLPWLSLCVLAARAEGLSVLDGVYGRLGDAAGFAAECEQGRDFGFDGKTLIHPEQVEAANRFFAPDEAEIAAARAVVAAFAAPNARGVGALRVEGRMVERLHAEMAERRLALHEAIAARHIS